MTKEELRKIQKEQYDQLPEQAKKEVDDGHGVVVYDLKNETTICKFNMDKICIPDEKIEALAETLLPDIIEFYKDENNKKLFEEWKKKQEKKKK